MKNLAVSTQLVHAGERHAAPAGLPVATPIYASATYTYSSMAEMERVLAGESPDYIYSRYGNPTVAALEEALATIENGSFASAYSSGMAALHAALFACDLTPGTVVLASRDLFGSSFDLLHKIFGAFGVKTQTADFTDLDALKKTVAEIKPRVLLAETISNPLLKICDIAACAEIAQRANARLIVDNTFATPYLCQPLNSGADFSVHSATKYLGGHGNATGGVVIAKEESDRPALVNIRRLGGGVLSVWEAHQISRGVKTLALRLEKQCSNAKMLAEHFSKIPQIEKVFYPGLGNEENLVNRVLRPPHAGALVSIRLKDDTRQAAFRFMDALKLCLRATSLGDVFTLVSHSATSSHRELSPQERESLGITDGLVRISAGIEDAADIIADIEQALDGAAQMQFSSRI